MRKRLGAIVGVLFLSCSSLFAFSEKLHCADRCFDNRRQEESLVEAKRLYKEIIKHSNNLDERIHAFDRFARLSVLEGELGSFISGYHVKKASQIFEQCIDMSESFSKDALGFVIPEYVYWRATCIGLWANNSSLWSLTLKSYLILEMVNLIKMGEQEFPDFDSGGFLLLAAGLNIRSRILKVVDHYRPEHAISLIERNHAQGVQNYMSYLLKAEAQSALNKKVEARATLQDAIKELESRMADHSLPPLLEVENIAILHMLKISAKSLVFSNYPEVH